MLVGLLLMRLGLLAIPLPAAFGMVLLVILFSNLAWWAWVDQRIGSARGVGVRSGPTRGWLRLLWGAHVLFVLSPLFMVLLGGRGLWDALPVTAITWTLAWHVVMVLTAALMAATGVLGLMARALGRLRRVTGAREVPTDESRRALLVRAVIAAPIVIVGSAVAGGFAQAGRFRVRRLTIRLPRLPHRLRGLTITHLSDLHVGRLFRPEHLPAVVDTVNELGSDLIAITGDIVDHSNAFLPAACDAIARMKPGLAHPYGRLLVIGNHDLIDSPRELLTELRDREPGFLYGRRIWLTINGETIQIAGLKWSRGDQPRGRDPGHAAQAEQALGTFDPDRFTIVLTHHPHAFDPLAERGVDLTLAGHTHGGQLMLTPPGVLPAIGGGRLLFRYIWGEYRRGHSALHVTAGVGNWFPVRVNAPAEIVQITLET